MKLFSKVLLTIVCALIWSHSYSQAINQDNAPSIKEVRANFQSCIANIDKTQEGNLVYSQIFVSHDPSEREGRIDLLTSQKKITPGQAEALKKTYQGYLVCRKDLLAGIQNTPYEAVDIKSFNQVDYIIAKLLTGRYTIGEANIDLTLARNQAWEEISLIRTISENNKSGFQRLTEQLKAQQQMRAGFYQCMAKITQEPDGKLAFGEILVPPNAAGNDKRMNLLTSKAKLNNEQKIVLRKLPNRTAVCEKDLLVKIKDTPFEAAFIDAIDSVNHIIANLLMDKITIGEANIGMTENRIKFWSRNISIFNHQLARLSNN
jgi:hypothetical protein